MTQFYHTLIATILTMTTGILFKKYLIFPEDWEYAQKKVDQWFD
jgi:hypothetical protein